MSPFLNHFDWSLISIESHILTHLFSSNLPNRVMMSSFLNYFDWSFIYLVSHILTPLFNSHLLNRVMMSSFLYHLDWSLNLDSYILPPLFNSDWMNMSLMIDLLNHFDWSLFKVSNQQIKTINLIFVFLELEFQVTNVTIELIDFFFSISYLF